MTSLISSASNVPVTIIWDSVAATSPKAELVGDYDKDSIGLQARAISKGMRKITGVIANQKVLFLCLNQIREKIGVMWGSPETTSGGRALKFYASVRIDIRRIETLKIGAEMIGNRVRAKIVKNKVAPPFKEAQFDIMFGQGISREGSLLDVGVDHGIVRKAGAWFTYDEVQLGQGKENSKRFLRENADIALQLETDVYKAVGLIESESNEDISEEETEDTTSE